MTGYEDGRGYREKEGEEYNHWVAGEEEDYGDEVDYKLTPNHKIRTPIMEETESTIEQVTPLLEKVIQTKFNSVQSCC